MRLLLTHILQQKLTVILFLIIFCSLAACGSGDKKESALKDSVSNRKKQLVKPLPGKDDALLSSEIQQGEVLIAYSDCFTCHTIDIKAKGPSFRDIAKRYPANKGYIELLAQKIIVGGSGVWGYPVMTPHPDLSVEHARLMVKYILSLEK
jgi:cytochrome c